MCSLKVFGFFFLKIFTKHEIQIVLHGQCVSPASGKHAIIVAESEEKTNDIREIDKGILLVLHFLREVEITLSCLQNCDMCIDREN